MTWTTPLPPFVVIAVLFATVLVTVLIYRAERPARARRLRFVAGACRILALSAILAALLGPGCRARTPDAERPRLAVLVDTSASMSIHAEDGASRSARIEAWLAKNLPALAAKHDVQLFRFDRDVTSISPGTSLKPTGDASRLNAAVRAVTGLATFDRTLVLTDGRETDRMPADTSVVEPEIAPNVAVAAVCFEDAGARDIALTDVDAPTACRPGDPFTVAFTIVALWGSLPSRTLEVRMVRGTHVVARKRVTLSHGTTRTALSHTPDESGAHRYTLEVDTIAGEQNETNNRRSLTVDVLTTPARVLLIDGRPRWFFRHLKNAAVRDPRMHVDVFLTTADFGYLQETSPGRPPLAQLPDAKAIREYDAIVIGDVGPADPMIARAYRDDRAWWTALDDYVVGGGGLVWVPGPEHLASWLSANGPKCIPVRRARPSKSAWYGETAFTLRLTRAGRRAEALRVLPDPDANRDLLEGRSFADGPTRQAALPSFHGRARGLVARPGAVTWATAGSGPGSTDTKPARTADLDAVITFGRVGAGRVIFCGTEETWVWRQEHEDRFFYRFWRQAIRRVARRSLAAGADGPLAADRSAYRVGDAVSFTTSGRRPSPIDAIGPSERRTRLAWRDGARPPRPGRQAESGRDGGATGRRAARVGFVAREAGLYRLEAGAEGRVVARVRVAPRPTELDRAAPDRAGLVRWLGTNRVFGPDEAITWPDEATTHSGAAGAAAIPSVADRSARPIWNRWWWLVCFTALLGVEWTCRMRMRIL